MLESNLRKLTIRDENIPSTSTISFQQKMKLKNPSHFFVNRNKALSSKVAYNNERRNR